VSIKDRQHIDAEVEEEFKFASDSSDDDYRLPIPDLPPRQHDHEAGGSSSATIPALLAILEGMRADQWRAAKEQVLMQKLIRKHKGLIPDSNVKACQPI